MSELLRFGLIGCGRVAPRHAQSIAELPGARLVAVADVRESRASVSRPSIGPTHTPTIGGCWSGPTWTW